MLYTHITYCYLVYHYHCSNQKEEEIEEILRKKYADADRQARSHFGDGGEEMSDEITQQTLLPGIK